MRNLNNELCIKSAEVMADIRSAAWLEQELHPELDRHRRHQMADICESGNIERVRRVLGIAVSEVRIALLRIIRPSGCPHVANEPECPSLWMFAFIYPLPPDVVTFLKEKIHEYLVASVMAERAAVIIPQCSGIWEERAKEARSSLRGMAATLRPPFGPVRRPLWPL